MDRMFPATALALTVAIISCMGISECRAQATTQSADLFSERILPILRSKNSSSCTECHFTRVELSDYIVEDQAATLAALRQAGLVDVQKPDESKILTFISRKPDRSSPEMQTLREREFDSFRTWLRAAVREPDLLAAKATSTIGTELPVEVIRHARTDRVMSSFVDNVWSELGRCVNCHSPEKNRRAIEKHGKEYVDSISWIIPNDPAATLKRLVDDGDIDLENPDDSPLLTKPSGREEHKGGRKFLVADPAYDKFLAFLMDYAAIRQGAYQAPQDLPAAPDELILLTQQHLRINGLPAQRPHVALRVDLYRWQHQQKRWAEFRSGTSTNAINAKKHMWQGLMSVIVPTRSAQADAVRSHPQLPKGPWLAKVFLEPNPEDATKENDNHRPNGDKHVSDSKLIGQFEITGDWPAGYQPPKTVHFRSAPRPQE